MIKFTDNPGQKRCSQGRRMTWSERRLPLQQTTFWVGYVLPSSLKFAGQLPFLRLQIVRPIPIPVRPRAASSDHKAAPYTAAAIIPPLTCRPSSVSASWFLQSPPSPPDPAAQRSTTRCITLSVGSLPPSPDRAGHTAIAPVMRTTA